jgi:hypothetical protein
LQPALFYALYQLPQDVAFGYNFTKVKRNWEGKVMSQEEKKTQTKCAWNNGRIMGDLPKEQRNAIAVKAGQASGRERKKRRAAKEILLDILHSQTTDSEMEQIAKVKGIEATELSALLMNMTKRASRSANMAELVFKLTGDLEQAPQQNITIVNQLSDEQLLAERQKILGGQDMIDITPRPPELE